MSQTLTELRAAASRHDRVAEHLHDCACVVRATVQVVWGGQGAALFREQAAARGVALDQAARRVEAIADQLRRMACLLEAA